MLYAMQIKAGSEKKICQLCNSILPNELYQACFYPRYEQIWKKNGQRKIITRPLFSGYLFVDTDDILKFWQQLWKVPELTKLLKIDRDFISIKEEEKKFLEMHSDSNHLFKMSKGYMIGEVVKIEEGAFAGYYGKLLYIDRHNRYGIMKVKMFGKQIEMHFGLEIAYKK